MFKVGVELYEGGYTCTIPHRFRVQRRAHSGSPMSTSQSRPSDWPKKPRYPIVVKTLSVYPIFWESQVGYVGMWGMWGGTHKSFVRRPSTDAACIRHQEIGGWGLGEWREDRTLEASREACSPPCIAIESGVRAQVGSTKVLCLAWGGG